MSSDGPLEPLPYSVRSELTRSHAPVREARARGEHEVAVRLAVRAASEILTKFGSSDDLMTPALRVVHREAYAHVDAAIDTASTHHLLPHFVNIAHQLTVMVDGFPSDHLLAPAVYAEANERVGRLYDVLDRTASSPHLDTIIDSGAAIGRRCQRLPDAARSAVSSVHAPAAIWAERRAALAARRGAPRERATALQHAAEAWVLVPNFERAWFNASNALASTTDDDLEGHASAMYSAARAARGDTRHRAEVGNHLRAVYERLTQEARERVGISLGRAWFELGQPRRAVQAFRDAYHRHHPVPYAAATDVAYLRALRQAGALREARRLHHERDTAPVDALPTRTPLERMWLVHEYGLATLASGRHDDGLRLLLRALGEYVDLEDVPYAQLQGRNPVEDFVETAILLNELDLAHDGILEVEYRIKELSDMLQRGDLYLWRGDIEHAGGSDRSNSRGRWEDALAAYQVATFGTEGDQLLRMGEAWRRLDPATAVEPLEQAAATFISEGRLERAATTHRVLGETLLAGGDRAGAVLAFQRAVTTFGSVGENHRAFVGAVRADAVARDLS